MLNKKTLNQIYDGNDPEELLGLFTFDESVTVEELVAAFNIWVRKFYPQFFKSDDAPFHEHIDRENAKVYLGITKTFTDIAFRGAAKTTRTKLFFAFVIANDRRKNRRRYLKVMSEDIANAKQTVTDIYNLFIDPVVKTLYPEIFQKTDAKREETMASFTTATGVKLTADSVGTSQRGDIQEEARPDFIWFDDFETRKTLKSMVLTKTIWDNMSEARDGLSVDGGALYTSNYLSERGNVHKLVGNPTPRTPVLVVPIIDENEPTWPVRYTLETIKQIEDDQKEFGDFEGEYLCKPSASKDIIFDREILDSMEKRAPIRDVAGHLIFKRYDPSHRYAMGGDVAGGVGLDSSTTVTIDFDTIPAQVVATYRNNEIKPDVFGDEMSREGDRFGQCLLAPEKNNHGAATIGRLKQIYPLDKIHQTERDDPRVDSRQGMASREYGWETNALTKPKMIFSFAKAVEDGLIALNDPALIAEARAFTRNDLMDAEIDPRLTTRHFDLLTAACIAWQMKSSPFLSAKKKDEYRQPDIEPLEYEGAQVGMAPNFGGSSRFEIHEGKVVPAGGGQSLQSPYEAGEFER